MKKLILLIGFLLAGFIVFGQAVKPQSETSVTLSQSQHVELFGGEIWYIDKTGGSDTNSGENPEDAFETIGAGIVAMAVGDALNIKAGTYTETGLDLNKNDCELWFEIGAIIDPASGTALTVSGNYCLVKGIHHISTNAGETGVLVSGNFCHLEHGRITTGAIGLQITGTGAMVNNYACGNQSSIAYDIQGGQARLRTCSTVGMGASYGYKINNNVDTGVLESCTSVGHETAGYYISTGSQDWSLIDCSSGSGDGKWVDVDNTNVWSNFSYDDELHAVTTFSAGVTTFNLFKVTGSVRISDINGHVETIIPGVSSTMYVELYSTGGAVDITDSPGIEISGAVVGALFVRNEDSSNNLDKADPNGTPAVAESTSYRDPKNEIDIVAENGVTTYVRLVLSVAQASGAIHWHCHWRPLTDEGFLEEL